MHLRNEDSFKLSICLPQLIKFDANIEPNRFVSGSILLQSNSNKGRGSFLTSEARIKASEAKLIYKFLPAKNLHTYQDIFHSNIT